ncbi:putative glycosyltransferase 3 [Spatholobus suberectus]|nr:putative glycosyltransferase 3 [Spatholobus suberectus]
MKQSVTRLRGLRVGCKGNKQPPSPLGSRTTAVARLSHRNRISVAFDSSRRSESWTSSSRKGRKREADEGEVHHLHPRPQDRDHERKAWFNQNPKFPKFIKAKPHILLSIGSPPPPQPCDNPIGDHYLLKSIKNKINCNKYNLVLHGYPDLLFEKKSWITMNTGSFLFKNCQRQIFKDILQEAVNLRDSGIGE